VVENRAVIQAGAAAECDMPVPPRERTIRILLVDDDPAWRGYVDDALSGDEGVRVDHSATYADGLTAIARNRYDAYLIDHRLGDRDGLSLIREGKRLGARGPMILMSGVDDDDALHEAALASGGSGYLAKHEVDARTLHVALRHAFDMQRTIDRLTEHEQRLERLYRSTVDDAPVGIAQITLDGRWLRANKPLCAMLGYDLAELAAAPHDDVVHPDDREQAAATRTELLAGTLLRLSFELRYRHRSGRFLPMRVTATLARDAAGVAEHFNLVVEDVGERNRLEDQFRQAQRVEAIGRLAGGVAHDFNNLLTAIIGFGELATSALAHGQPPHEELAEILNAANSAASLTRQLLAFSRKQILRTEILDLNTVVGDMVGIISRTIGEDVELSTRLSSDAWLVVADKGQIEQVVMNLAINARDAMPDGGRLAVETANVQLDDLYSRRHVGASTGPHVMLTISDTGVGMTADTQAHLFEPFFTTKEMGKGTGLGLSTVYGIVKQLGGSIWVYSEPGRGTTFKIYLPRASHAHVASPVPASAPAPARAGKETILLVEDHADVRTVTRQALERAGYRVLDAASHGDAIQIACTYDEPIHLLFTDVVIPRMGGRALATEIARCRPGIRVLYMSGYTDDVIVHRGVLDAGVHFIQKPFTLNGVTEKVRSVLDAPDPAA
jgi:PAS domain S-box-containing protein